MILLEGLRPSKKVEASLFKASKSFRLYPWGFLGSEVERAQGEVQEDQFRAAIATQVRDEGPWAWGGEGVR